MPIKQHRDASVQAVLDAFGGQVKFELLYLPKVETLGSGYETLRRVVVWINETHGRPIPFDVQETLRWLRDHFGPDSDRKKAAEKHNPPMTVVDVPVALGHLGAKHNVPAQEVLARLILDSMAKVKDDPTITYDASAEERQKQALDVADEILSRLQGCTSDRSASSTSPTSASSPAS